MEDRQLEAYFTAIARDSQRVDGRLSNLEGDMATLKQDVLELKQDMAVVKSDVAEIKETTGDILALAKMWDIRDRQREQQILQLRGLA